MRHQPPIARALGLSAALLSLLVVQPATAQQRHELQTWSAILGTATFSPDTPRAMLWFDGHLRRGDAGAVVLARPGLGAQLTSWMSVWGGYAWIPNFSDEGGARVDEQRLWQQVIFANAWRDQTLHLQSRTRFEQRIHESTDALGLRLRQLVRGAYRPTADARWEIVIWDELFWGLNAPGFAPQGFDQNRLFVGPALHARPGARLEAGYLWVSLLRQDAMRHDHALAINLFFTLAP